MDCSPSGSSVHGNLQARILEWVEWIATWLSPNSRPEGTHWPWPPHCPRPGARSAGTFREAGPSGIQLWQVTPAGPLATSYVCFHKRALSRQPSSTILRLCPLPRLCLPTALQISMGQTKILHEIPVGPKTNREEEKEPAPKKCIRVG